MSPDEEEASNRPSATEILQKFFKGQEMSSWNHLLISIENYQINMTRNIARAQLRYINSASIRLRRSQGFLNDVRKQLAFLRFYNEEVYKSKKKFPHTKWLMQLLVRYVALEYEVWTFLGGRRETEMDVKNRMLYLLYLMLNDPKESRTKPSNKTNFVILKIILAAKEEYKVSDEFCNNLVRHILDSAGLLKEVENIYKQKNTLASNVWFNRRLNPMVNLEEYGTDSEDSDVASGDEASFAIAETNSAVRDLKIAEKTVFGDNYNKPFKKQKDLKEERVELCLYEDEPLPVQQIKLDLDRPTEPNDKRPIKTEFRTHEAPTNKVPSPIKSETNIQSDVILLDDSEDETPNENTQKHSEIQLKGEDDLLCDDNEDVVVIDDEDEVLDKFSEDHSSKKEDKALVPNKGKIKRKSKKLKVGDCVVVESDSEDEVKIENVIGEDRRKNGEIKSSLKEENVVESSRKSEVSRKRCDQSTTTFEKCLTTVEGKCKENSFQTDFPRLSPEPRYRSLGAIPKRFTPKATPVENNSRHALAKIISLFLIEERNYYRMCETVETKVERVLNTNSKPTEDTITSRLCEDNFLKNMDEHHRSWTESVTEKGEEKCTSKTIETKRKSPGKKLKQRVVCRKIEELISSKESLEAEECPKPSQDKISKASITEKVKLVLPVEDQSVVEHVLEKPEKTNTKEKNLDVRFSMVKKIDDPSTIENVTEKKIVENVSLEKEKDGMEDLLLEINQKRVNEVQEDLNILKDKDFVDIEKEILEEIYVEETSLKPKNKKIKKKSLDTRKTIETKDKKHLLQIDDVKESEEMTPPSETTTSNSLPEPIQVNQETLISSSLTTEVASSDSPETTPVEPEKPSEILTKPPGVSLNESKTDKSTSDQEQTIESSPIVEDSLEVSNENTEIKEVAEKEKSIEVAQEKEINVVEEEVPVGALGNTQNEEETIEEVVQMEDKAVDILESNQESEQVVQTEDKAAEILQNNEEKSTEVVLNPEEEGIKITGQKEKTAEIVQKDGAINRNLKEMIESKGSGDKHELDSLKVLEEVEKSEVTASTVEIIDAKKVEEIKDESEIIVKQKDKVKEITMLVQEQIILFEEAGVGKKVSFNLKEDKIEKKLDKTTAVNREFTKKEDVVKETIKVAKEKVVKEAKTRGRSKKVKESDEIESILKEKKTVKIVENKKIHGEAKKRGRKPSQNKKTEENQKFDKDALTNCTEIVEIVPVSINENNEILPAECNEGFEVKIPENLEISPVKEKKKKEVRIQSLKKSEEILVPMNTVENTKSIAQNNKKINKITKKSPTKLKNPQKTKKSQNLDVYDIPLPPGPEPKKTYTPAKKHLEIKKNSKKSPEKAYNNLEDAYEEISEDELDYDNIANSSGEIKEETSNLDVLARAAIQEYVNLKLSEKLPMKKKGKSPVKSPRKPRKKKGKNIDMTNKRVTRSCAKTQPPPSVKVLNEVKQFSEALNEDSSDSYEGKLIIPDDKSGDDEPEPESVLITIPESEDVNFPILEQVEELVNVPQVPKEVPVEKPTVKKLSDLAIQPEPIPDVETVCKNLEQDSKKTTNHMIDIILGKPSEETEDDEKCPLKTKAALKSFSKTEAFVKLEKIDIEAVKSKKNLESNTEKEVLEIVAEQVQIEKTDVVDTVTNVSESTEQNIIAPSEELLQTTECETEKTVEEIPLISENSLNKSDIVLQTTENLEVVETVEPIISESLLKKTEADVPSHIQDNSTPDNEVLDFTPIAESTIMDTSISSNETELEETVIETECIAESTGIDENLEEISSADLNSDDTDIIEETIIEDTVIEVPLAENIEVTPTESKLETEDSNKIELEAGDKALIDNSTEIAQVAELPHGESIESSDVANVQVPSDEISSVAPNIDVCEEKVITEEVVSEEVVPEEIVPEEVVLEEVVTEEVFTEEFVTEEVRVEVQEEQIHEELIAFTDCDKEVIAEVVTELVTQVSEEIMKENVELVAEKPLDDIVIPSPIAQHQNEDKNPPVEISTPICSDFKIVEENTVIYTKTIIPESVLPSVEEVIHQSIEEEIVEENSSVTEELPVEISTEIATTAEVSTPELLTAVSTSITLEEPATAVFPEVVNKVCEIAIQEITGKGENAAIEGKNVLEQIERTALKESKKTSSRRHNRRMESRSSVESDSETKKTKTKREEEKTSPVKENQTKVEIEKDHEIEECKNSKKDEEEKVMEVKKDKVEKDRKRSKEVEKKEIDVKKVKEVDSKKSKHVDIKKKPKEESVDDSKCGKIDKKKEKCEEKSVKVVEKEKIQNKESKSKEGDKHREDKTVKAKEETKRKDDVKAKEETSKVSKSSKSDSRSRSVETAIKKDSKHKESRSKHSKHSSESESRSKSVELEKLKSKSRDRSISTERKSHEKEKTKSRERSLSIDRENKKSDKSTDKTKSSSKEKSSADSRSKTEIKSSKHRDSSKGNKELRSKDKTKEAEKKEKKGNEEKIKEVHTRSRSKVDEEIKEEVKQDKKLDVKQDKKPDVKQDKKQDVKQGKKEDVKQDKKEDLKQDKKEDVKQDKKEKSQETKKEEVKVLDKNKPEELKVLEEKKNKSLETKTNLDDKKKKLGQSEKRKSEEMKQDDSQTKKRKLEEGKSKDVKKSTDKKLEEKIEEDCKVEKEKKHIIEVICKETMIEMVKEVEKPVVIEATHKVEKDTSEEKCGKKVEEKRFLVENLSPKMVENVVETNVVKEKSVRKVETNVVIEEIKKSNSNEEKSSKKIEILADYKISGGEVSKTIKLDIKTEHAVKTTPEKGQISPSKTIETIKSPKFRSFDVENLLSPRCSSFTISKIIEDSGKTKSPEIRRASFENSNIYNSQEHQKTNTTEVLSSPTKVAHDQIAGKALENLVATKSTRGEKRKAPSEEANEVIKRMRKVPIIDINKFQESVQRDIMAYSIQMEAQKGKAKRENKIREKRKSINEIIMSLQTHKNEHDENIENNEIQESDKVETDVENDSINHGFDEKMVVLVEDTIAEVNKGIGEEQVVENEVIKKHPVLEMISAIEEVSNSNIEELNEIRKSEKVASEKIASDKLLALSEDKPLAQTPDFNVKPHFASLSEKNIVPEGVHQPDTVTEIPIVTAPTNIIGIPSKLSSETPSLGTQSMLTVEMPQTALPETKIEQNPSVAKMIADDFNDEDEEIPSVAFQIQNIVDTVAETSEDISKIPNVIVEHIPQYNVDAIPTTSDIILQTKLTNTLPMVSTEVLEAFINTEQDPSNIIPVSIAMKSVLPVSSASLDIINKVDGQLLTSTVTMCSQLNTPSVSFVNDLHVASPNEGEQSDKNFGGLDVDETPLCEKVKACGFIQVGNRTAEQTSVGGPFMNEQTNENIMMVKVMERLDDSPVDENDIFPLSGQVMIDTNLPSVDIPIDNDLLIVPDASEDMFVPTICKEETIEHEEDHTCSESNSPLDVFNDDDDQRKDEFSAPVMSIEKMSEFLNNSLAHLSQQRSVSPRNVKVEEPKINNVLNYGTDLSKLHANKEPRFPLANFAFDDIEGIKFSELNWPQNSEPPKPQEMKPLILNGHMSVPELLTPTKSKPKVEIKTPTTTLAKVVEPPITPEKGEKPKEVKPKAKSSPRIGKVHLVSLQKLKSEAVKTEVEPSYAVRRSYDRTRVSAPKKKSPKITSPKTASPKSPEILRVPTEPKPVKKNDISSILDIKPVEAKETRGLPDFKIQNLDPKGKAKKKPTFVRTITADATPQKRKIEDVEDPEEKIKRLKDEVKRKPGLSTEETTGDPFDQLLKQNVNDIPKPTPLTYAAPDKEIPRRRQHSGSEDKLGERPHGSTNISPRTDYHHKQPLSHSERELTYEERYQRNPSPAPSHSRTARRPPDNPSTSHVHFKDAPPITRRKHPEPYKAPPPRTSRTVYPSPPSADKNRLPQRHHEEPRPHYSGRREDGRAGHPAVYSSYKENSQEERNRRFMEEGPSGSRDYGTGRGNLRSARPHRTEIKSDGGRHISQRESLLQFPLSNLRLGNPRLSANNWSDNDTAWLEPVNKLLPPPTVLFGNPTETSRANEESRN